MFKTSSSNVRIYSSPINVMVWVESQQPSRQTVGEGILFLVQISYFDVNILDELVSLYNYGVGKD